MRVSGAKLGNLGTGGTPGVGLEVGSAPRGSSGPLQIFFSSRGELVFRYLSLLGCEQGEKKGRSGPSVGFRLPSHLEMNRMLIDLPTCTSPNKTGRPGKNFRHGSFLASPI